MQWGDAAPGVPLTSPHPPSPCPATVAGVHYFTADLHLAHPKLAQLRGFASVDAHDVVMAALYRPDPGTDVLWVLGDICSGGVASMESP